MNAPDGIAALEASGFHGFLTIGQLQRSGCLEVPVARGVYAVLSKSDAPHGFLRRSTAPVWRSRDPSLSEEELGARWIEGATLLYVGRARGPGVRSLLRQRVKRYLRFGDGRVVAHWGGRLIWQLRESSRLVLAWRVCEDAEDPTALEVGMLQRFEQHYGALPFANLRHEGVPDDEDAAEGANE